MSDWRIGVFGVRHLSPSGAWHLRRYLDEVKPSVVLIEGAADIEAVSHHIVAAGTKPPVAILAYTDSVPVRTIVYPLANYSPEYQAMVWAKENKARVEFIDLPSEVFLGLLDREYEKAAQKRAEEERLQEEESNNDSPAPPEKAEEATIPKNDWRPEPRQSIYRMIAEREGEPDYDSFWERRFEHNLNHDSYRKAAFELGRQLRDEEDEPTWRAENLVREAFMRRRIEEVLQKGVHPQKIVAVVGAFHAPVLTGEYPSMTDAELASLPRRGSKLTLMPYSYNRLSLQSGYGAGNKAPSYFELFWEMLNGTGLQDLPHHYLSHVTRRLREAGTPRSTAEVIEGVRLARTLSALHDGSAPTLNDLHDAAVTLLGHGEALVVREALAKTDIGDAIGELPKGVGKTSIQEDFDRQLDALKLAKYRKTTAEEIALDLRENRHVKSSEAAFLDLRRSFFLHRLIALDIGFAKPARVAASNTTWAEKWTLQWTPESEISLVEAVLLGETVELATAYKFNLRLDAITNIADAADLVRDACRCGLPAAMDRARIRLQELSAVSAEFTALSHAARELSMVTRYGDVRKFDPSPLLPLIDELFVQGALALQGAAGCDNAAAMSMIVGIDELNHVSLEHSDRVDGELWISKLKKLADSDDRNPLLSGYACAVLLERGMIENADLSREVSRRLSPGVPADLGAGWFEGLAKRNRHALLSRQTLWSELAEYVKSLDSEQFKRALVFLRRAFCSFSPRDKRTICENLAEIWGAHADTASEAIEAPLSEEETKSLDSLNDFDFGDLT